MLDYEDSRAWWKREEKANVVVRCISWNDTQVAHLGAEAHVSCGWAGLLAQAAIGAGVLRAGLAAGDAHPPLPSARDVGAAQPQPADAAHEAAREAQVRAHLVVAGQPAQVQRLHQVQALQGKLLNMSHGRHFVLGSLLHINIVQHTSFYKSYVVRKDDTTYVRVWLLLKNWIEVQIRFVLS